MPCTVLRKTDLTRLDVSTYRSSFFDVQLRIVDAPTWRRPQTCNIGRAEISGRRRPSMLPIIAGSVWLAASMPVPMSWLVAGGT